MRHHAGRSAEAAGSSATRRRTWPGASVSILKRSCSTRSPQPRAPASHSTCLTNRLPRAWLALPSGSQGRRDEQPSRRPSATSGVTLGGGRADDGGDGRDLVGGATALGRVLPDHLLVGRHVHAVDLVGCHVALDPLDLRPQLLQHAARLLRDSAQLIRAELACPWNLALDHVSWHRWPSFGAGARWARRWPRYYAGRARPILLKS